ncbi:hypothetical protein CupriaWKF_32865 [Cupriavidus sp. WKF15]|uniref:hypothetical protein n=1 Tax=Cupriavidus sp. WKF15 TaxID=3032282 RepID=UPI0023E34770|nr:hypothetical protein [Cupriavidus sp. WKF15]WER50377.1 hypothetical protein CupriaWKF_32865 [Cupriavidus sp. WKF15]
MGWIKEIGIWSARAAFAGWPQAGPCILELRQYCYEHPAHAAQRRIGIFCAVVWETGGIHVQKKATDGSHASRLAVMQAIDLAKASDADAKGDLRGRR